MHRAAMRCSVYDLTFDVVISDNTKLIIITAMQPIRLYHKKLIGVKEYRINTKICETRAALKTAFPPTRLRKNAVRKMPNKVP